MELKISKSTLLQGLYLAQGIADRKSTMPILANVLLRTDGKDKVILAATDLNVTVTAELSARVEKEGGLTLGAKAFNEIVRALPGDEVVLRRGENNYAHIKAGKVEYNVVGMADRDFPRLPNHREVSFAEIDATAFADMIAKTFFSISTDETRYHLNGVLFECDGEGEQAKARMVSTDGHRLSKVERVLVNGPKIPTGVIIPRKGLLELRKALESADRKVGLGLHQGHLFIRAGSTVLTIKLIEAQFPPYEQVIPKEHTKVVGVPKAAFLEALKRISIMSSDKTHGVKFTVEPGVLRIQSDNPELGQGREELDVDYEGAALTIGFNARYFIELLSEMQSAEVKLELSGELDPALLRPAEGEYLGVVMPMRI